MKIGGSLIPTHKDFHLGLHNNYNNQILAKLDQFENLYPNASVEETAIAIEGFQTYLKNLIETNQTTHINELVIDFIW